mgnify:CR=1 FL=1
MVKDRRLWGLSLAILGAALVGAGGQHKGSRGTLPEGEGRRILLSACVQCHGLGEIFAHRADAAGWEEVVSDMVARGTTLLPGEFEVLVQYLAQHFGPLVNINLLSEEELASRLAIERPLAAAIVRYRERRGPFRRITDLLNVEGMSEEIFERIREKITVGRGNER